MLIEVNVFPPPDNTKIQNEFFVLADLLRTSIISADRYPIVIPVDSALWLDKDLFDIMVSVLAKSGWDLWRHDYSTEKYCTAPCTLKDGEEPESVKNLPSYTYAYHLKPSREVLLNLIKEIMNAR